MKKDLFEISGHKLTLKEAFERVLENFLENRNKSFEILETIVLSCVLIEILIKEELKKINPTLLLDKNNATNPEIVALISGKEGKLLKETNYKLLGVKTANISELLIRYEKFYDIHQYKDGISNFFGLRNEIIHSAERVILKENDISIKLTKYIFPFIRKYINVRSSIWRGVKKISDVIESDFKSNLVRKILKFRKLPKKIGSHNKKSGNELTCPACKNISLLLSFDVDCDEDGCRGMYIFAECKACGLVLDEDEIDEIIENPGNYCSITKEELSDWEGIIYDIKNPDYSDVYDDY